MKADFVLRGAGRLVTCAPGLGEGVLGVIENGALAASEGVVRWVGVESELKSLENLQTKFPKDLIVYFVALDGRGDKDVKPYMEKAGHRLPVLIDPKMAVAREHGIRWIPVTLVIDRSGVIVGRAIGPREWDAKEAVEFVQSVVKK